MKYTTVNEFEHFDFQDTYVKDIELGSDYFRLWLDNAKILPENSKNRDIRRMRANGLSLTIHGMRILSFVREGVKIYNADGVPMGSRPDEPLAQEAYMEILPLFLEGSVPEFAREQEGDKTVYHFAVDASDESTYAVALAGESDTEEWDKFLNMDSV
ncbi:MAG: subtilin biosynthesis sensor protein SpaK [Blautia sp.]|nr:subtilin biosynthesis sensor protein SpaK [Blautia sp.]